MAVHVPWLAAHHNGMMLACQIIEKPSRPCIGRAWRGNQAHSFIEKISQEKLALLTEVDRSYVGRVERGDNNVAVLTLSRLADALDISISELMQEAGL